MADKTFVIRVRDSGDDFDDTGSNGVRLYESDGSTEYTGNAGSSGDFSYDSDGIWEIGVDENDSGLYVVKTTTDGVAFTVLNGFNPYKIDLENYLKLSGGTMTGNVVLDDNSIVGVDEIQFTDNSSGGIGISGSVITMQNLLDKSANETVTGDWACTGFFNIASDKLKIDGTAVTATASEVNLLDGINKVADMTTGVAGVSNTKTVANDGQSFTAAEAGYVAIDTSGGNVTMSLPAITAATAGLKYIMVCTDGTNSFLLRDNAADSGFSFMTGDKLQTTNGEILLADTGDMFIIESSGYPTGYWIITGGYNVDMQN